MAGRSGARPIPPVTTTTSPPSASSSGQVLPKGPRTPSCVAWLAEQIARVAAPTARTVWTSGPPPLIELTEIGTSPAPKA